MVAKSWDWSWVVSLSSVPEWGYSNPLDPPDQELMNCHGEFAALISSFPDKARIVACWAEVDPRVKADLHMFLGRWEFLCNTMCLQWLLRWLLQERKGGSCYQLELKIFANISCQNVGRNTFTTMIIFFLLDWHETVISWNLCEVLSTCTVCISAKAKYAMY